ncbi:MAG: ABC transporter ATP-binding protein [Candidatus Magasanikbacteria bacterium]
MQKTTKQTLKTYWQHTKGNRFIMFVVIFALIGVGIVNVSIPLFFKSFFDILTLGEEGTNILVGKLINLLFIIAGLELLQWAFWRIATFTSAFFQPKIMAKLANTCFANLHLHSYSYFNNNFIGSLVKKVNRFVYAFERIIDRIFWNLIGLFVNVTLIVVVLFIKSPILGTFLLIWLIVFIVINSLLANYRFKFDLERNQVESKSSGILADTLTNHVNVKLFCGLDREKLNFAKIQDRVRELRQKVWNIENFFEAAQGLLTIILEVGLIYVGIRLWQVGKFTVGDFVLLQSYMLIVFMRIWDFGRVIRNIYQDLSEAEEMTQIFNTPHEIINSKSAKDIKVKKGKIEFQDVVFSYKQTRKVLKDFNLKIKAGERVALVGPSGAGKTTVTRLLLRLHDIDRGKILIDDQNIIKVTLESLWQNVSLVPQDPILFHRTLIENIRYGKPEATDDEVFKAAGQAHCDKFIDDLPDKYNTYVGERGVKLSGGERQRVAIARAILRNAPILVLDEATSSLDSESEHLIQDALDNLMKKKTVIVIAHRLSTIMKMDRIIVIDEGGIVEQGTHQQLLQKKGGIYKKLWKYQAGGFIS